MTVLTTAKFASVFATGAVMAEISPTDIKEIIVAVGVLTAGVGVVIVNIITARSASRRLDFQAGILDAQGKKLDLTLLKTEVIEGHVNSEKTEAAGKIAALRQENTLLREIMADKKETAALLAQSVATKPLAVILPPVKVIAAAKAEGAVEVNPC